MIIYIVLALILVLAFIVAVVVLRGTKRKKISSAVSKSILKELDLVSNRSYEEQIIQFDKLLDFALKDLGKQGTLGEKLKDSSMTFTNLDDVWYAHKLRNKIAHEISFKIDDSTFSKAKNIFFKAFKDLGIKI